MPDSATINLIKAGDSGDLPVTENNAGLAGKAK
jgi:hypothetical protein